MSVFDKYILKKDNLVRRRMDIDVSLYEELSSLSENIYDASINKLINVAIIDMIKKGNIKPYERNKDEIAEQHNLLIRETSYRELEKLKITYGIPIYKLINTAIYNALNS